MKNDDTPDAEARKANASLPGRVRSLAAILGVAASLVTGAAAQESVQANNPIAGAVSLNFQNEYIGNLSGIDEDANILNLRSVIPMGENWIVRATVPVVTLPVLESVSPLRFEHETGLGDINVFAIRLLDIGTPGVQFGIGPNLTFPSATVDELGGDTLNAGIANVLFNFTNPRFQWGYLAVWETDIAKNFGDAEDVSRAVFQPFGIYQLGEGWYLRSTAVWNYDFETDNYSIPVGFGFGRVIPMERTVINAFFEPQYAVATNGDGQREWGIFTGINFQFR